MPAPLVAAGLWWVGKEVVSYALDKVGEKMSQSDNKLVAMAGEGLSFGSNFVGTNSLLKKVVAHNVIDSVVSHSSDKIAGAKERLTEQGQQIAMQMKGFIDTAPNQQAMDAEVQHRNTLRMG